MEANLVLFALSSGSFDSMFGCCRMKRQSIIPDHDPTTIHLTFFNLPLIVELNICNRNGTEPIDLPIAHQLRG